MSRLHVPGDGKADLLNQINCIQDENVINIRFKPDFPKGDRFLFMYDRVVD